jgi:UDPglucose--hexose-1-phosphate uridylyltransferase
VIAGQKPTCIAGRGTVDLRVDPLSGRQVVIAPRRGDRPGVSRPQLDKETPEELERCPFDEGREDRTPPETFAAGLTEREPDSPGWLVRVVPNLYPAFERQEVVVHSPRHVRSLADVSDTELSFVALAWKERAAAAASEGFPYVHAVINEGRDAGASLLHSHSQLVWLRSTPPAAAIEQTSECVVCELLTEGPLRLEGGDPIGVAVHPAGRAPYEFLVGPLEHDERGLASPLLEYALYSLALWLRRLHGVEGRVPFNAWVHTQGHWHIEVVPRLTVFAGVELGAGIYVNPLPPEQAARALQQAPP